MLDTRAYKQKKIRKKRVWEEESGSEKQRELFTRDDKNTKRSHLVVTSTERAIFTTAEEITVKPTPPPSLSLQPLSNCGRGNEEANKPERKRDYRLDSTPSKNKNKPIRPHQVCHLLMAHIPSSTCPQPRRRLRPRRQQRQRHQNKPKREKRKEKLPGKKR